MGTRNKYMRDLYYQNRVRDPSEPHTKLLDRGMEARVDYRDSIINKAIGLPSFINRVVNKEREKDYLFDNPTSAYKEKPGWLQQALNYNILLNAGEKGLSAAISEREKMERENEFNQMKIEAYASTSEGQEEKRKFEETAREQRSLAEKHRVLGSLNAAGYVSEIGRAHV